MGFFIYRAYTKLKISSNKLYLRNMQRIIENRRKELAQECKSLQIDKLYAFGSVVSQKFNEESDIDLLISFSDKLSIEEYTNNYFTLHYRLRELFKRDVDIVTERSLSNPYFIESINENKVLLYEA